MLLEILRRHPVVGQLRVAGKLIILVDNLLRRTTHLAFRPGAVEDAVNDVTATGAVTIVL